MKTYLVVIVEGNSTEIVLLEKIDAPTQSQRVNVYHPELIISKKYQITYPYNV